MIESGYGGQDDRDSVRRNLSKAATQIPLAPNQNDVCCGFIGSAVEADKEDVRSVLYCDLPEGHPQRVPGLFDVDSPIPGYGHLHGVIHFSLNFVPIDNSSVRVIRTAHLFPGRLDTNDLQAQFLDNALRAYALDTEIEL